MAAPHPAAEGNSQGVLALLQAHSDPQSLEKFFKENGVPVEFGIVRTSGVWSCDAGGIYRMWFLDAWKPLDPNFFVKSVRCRAPEPWTNCAVYDPQYRTLISLYMC